MNLNAVYCVTRAAIHAVTQYALANVEATIGDANEAMDLYLDAGTEAERIGRECSFHGIDMPVALEFNGYLVHQFDQGYQDGLKLREMQHCLGCKNAHGDPCVFHG